jgi:hypothetical protein
MVEESLPVEPKKELKDAKCDKKIHFASFRSSQELTAPFLCTCDRKVL